MYSGSAFHEVIIILKRLGKILRIYQRRTMGSYTTSNSKNAWSWCDACSSRTVSLVLSLCVVAVYLPLLAVISSPLPNPQGIQLLRGLEQKYQNTKDVVNDDETRDKFKGFLKTTGILGLDVSLLNNTPIIRELLKNKGVIDKAIGTGSIVIGEKAQDAAGDVKTNPSLPATMQPSVKDEEAHMAEGLGPLEGMRKLLEAGKNGGKEVKLLPTAEFDKDKKPK